MTRPSYLWDYDLDEADFQALLQGQKTLGRLDRDWAAVRLLEYAPYPEIVHRLGFAAIVEGWPTWRHRLRSESRRRGFDFLVQWLPEHYPELRLEADGASMPSEVFDLKPTKKSSPSIVILRGAPATQRIWEGELRSLLGPSPAQVLPARLSSPSG